MQLPPEILDFISAYLVKRDLKQLRLACKELAEVAVPYLFDTLFLSHDQLDLIYAEWMLAYFYPMIKTVVVSPLRYKELDQSSYEEAVCRVTRCERLSQFSFFDSHIAVGYRQYCTVWKRTAQPPSMAPIEELLRKTVNCAPNVSRLVITHRHRYSDIMDDELMRGCPGWLCPIPQEMHACFRLSPWQSLKISNSADIERPLVAILSEPDASMKELIMDPVQEGTGCFKMPIECFFSFGSMKDRMPRFLIGLAKLRLNINEQFAGQPDFFSTGIIADLLSHAQNLKCLYLELHSPGSTPGTFRHTLGGCKFPKLQILVLKEYSLDVNELIEFFSYSPGLKHFIIESCWLIRYLWKDLIEDIKAHTKLEAIHMNVLQQGFEAATGRRGLDCYVDENGDVENFVLHNGPNPFSVERLGSYTAEWWQDKNRVYPRMPKKYYDRYF